VKTVAVESIAEHLAVPGLDVAATDDDDVIRIVWTHEGVEAARATVQRTADALIWDEFFVLPEYKRQGIFTAATDYGARLLEENGIQSKIARNAHEAAFYRSVGFDDEPGDGAYMILNASRYQAWRNR
jgi:GNAT superfamily N-acetyltransferase